MNEARRVRLCFPEPPTPTRRALPQSVRMIREIWAPTHTLITTSFLFIFKFSILCVCVCVCMCVWSKVNIKGQRDERWAEVRQAWWLMAWLIDKIENGRTEREIETLRVKEPWWGESLHLWRTPGQGWCLGQPHYTGPGRPGASQTETQNWESKNKNVHINL